jgi:hypothetical protein
MRNKLWLLSRSCAPSSILRRSCRPECDADPRRSGAQLHDQAAGAAGIPDPQCRHDAGSTVNMSEQVDGVSFAGVRYEFLLYPQEPGAYAISDRLMTVTLLIRPRKGQFPTEPARDGIGLPFATVLPSTGSVNQELAQAGQIIGAVIISYARALAFFIRSSFRFQTLRSVK